MIVVAYLNEWPQLGHERVLRWRKYRTLRIAKGQATTLLKGGFKVWLEESGRPATLAAGVTAEMVEAGVVPPA